MTWVELLAAFLVCHMAGDFFLQTEAQAIHKAGGLGPDPVARRALLAHVAWYGVGMLPAVAWIASNEGALVGAGVLLLIVIPHAIQDDRRLLALYARRVKGTDPQAEPLVMFGLDQAGHIITLCLTALLASAI